ncbi:MAG: permease [Bacillota bacterium]
MIYLLVLILLVILAVIDPAKTKLGVKKGFQKLVQNLPAFLNMIILVAISLYFISDQMIIKYLGAGSGLTGLFLAIMFGSISLMPGFIAFPLAGTLLNKGVSYTIIAAFTTTLMMVGILTYPLEKSYFGVKVTLLRNLISLIIAIIISLLVGIFYGELIV